jgi:hypothetical protein
MASISPLVPSDLKQQIYNIIFNEKFKWSYYSSSVYIDSDNLFQFAHLVSVENKIYSNYFDDFLKILDCFEEKTGLTIKRILRIKVNLTTKRYVTEEENMTGIHRDYDLNKNENIMALIYYVNDSDGDPVILDEN